MGRWPASRRWSARAFNSRRLLPRLLVLRARVHCARCRTRGLPCWRRRGARTDGDHVLPSRKPGLQQESPNGRAAQPDQENCGQPPTAERTRASTARSRVESLPYLHRPDRNQLGVDNSPAQALANRIAQRAQRVQSPAGLPRFASSRRPAWTEPAWSRWPAVSWSGWWSAWWWSAAARCRRPRRRNAKHRFANRRSLDSGAHSLQAVSPRSDERL